MENPKAEQLKNKGNEEFKKGNLSAAINNYTEALGKQDPAKLTRS